MTGYLGPYLGPNSGWLYRAFFKPNGDWIFRALFGAYNGGWVYGAYITCVLPDLWLSTQLQY